MQKTKLLFLLCIVFIAPQSIFAQNGLDFDGVNDYVQTTYNGVLGSADRTFEAWIYLTGTPSSNIAILDYGLNANGSRNTFIVNPNLALGFISGGTNANFSSTPNVVPIGQWVHVAFVLDNGTGFLYLNGNQVGTGSLTSVNTPSGNQDLRIGQRVLGGSIPFKGSIDEVRVWNTAKTQQELMTNMNRELCTITPDLQVYYRMNEGIAGGTNTGLTTLVDLSGNNHNGILTNHALTGATSNWVTGASLNGGFTASSLTTSLCDSFTWSANGLTYYVSGVYNTQLTGGNSNGCDSMLTLDLSINYSTNNTTTTAACDSFTWSTNGMVYNMSGTYSDTLISSAGCDSILTLNLSINNSTSSIIDTISCDSFTWSVNGMVYNTSGTYYETLSNNNGCDSILTLNLTINNSTISTMNITACSSYTWVQNGFVYYNSGSYFDTLTSSTGCDSILLLNLSIDSLDNSVLNVGDSLFSNQNNASSYQWLDCDNNYAQVAGATSSVFHPMQAGNYAVAVVNGTCADTSNCEIITSIKQISTNNLYHIYPNPARKALTITVHGNLITDRVQIFSISGVLVKEIYIQNQTTLVDVSKLTNGIYFIQYGADTRKLILHK